MSITVWQRCYCRTTWTVQEKKISLSFLRVGYIKNTQYSGEILGRVGRYMFFLKFFKTFLLGNEYLLWNSSCILEHAVDDDITSTREVWLNESIWSLIFILFVQTYKVIKWNGLKAASWMQLLTCQSGRPNVLIVIMIWNLLLQPFSITDDKVDCSNSPSSVLYMLNDR